MLEIAQAVLKIVILLPQPSVAVITGKHNHIQLKRHLLGSLSFLSHVCVCVYVCFSVCICVCGVFMCAFICVCVHTYLCVCGMCVYVRAHACACVGG